MTGTRLKVMFTSKHEIVIMGYENMEEWGEDSTFTGNLQVQNQAWELKLVPKREGPDGRLWFHLGIIKKEVSAYELYELSAAIQVGSDENDVIELGVGQFHTAYGSGGWFSLPFDKEEAAWEVPMSTNRGVTSNVTIHVVIKLFGLDPEK